MSVNSSGDSALKSTCEIMLTINRLSDEATIVLQEPLHRCVSIGVLTVGLVGLCILGGAGWSVDAALAGSSSGADEIVVLEGSNFDLGADYRGTTMPSAGEDAPAEHVTTAGVGDSLGIGAALIAPDDRRDDVRIGGLLYVHAISIVGAAVVAGRILVGWRIDIRGLAFEPNDRRLVDPGYEVDQHAALVTDGGSQHEK